MNREELLYHARVAKKISEKGGKMATRTYAAGRNIVIGDRPGLAALFRRLITERFGGSVKRAAAESGVTRALLRRILSAEQRHVRTDNAHLLRQMAGREWRTVEQLLLAEPVRERLSRYDEWLHDAMHVAANGSQDGHSLEHQTWMNRLREQFPSEWAPLVRAVTRRHYRARAELAFDRVIAPLLDTFDTAGIERSPFEFKPAELRAFIKAGVKRECLLLEREADPKRAQSAPMPVPLRDVWMQMLNGRGRRRKQGDGMQWLEDADAEGDSFDM